MAKIIAQVAPVASNVIKFDNQGLSFGQYLKLAQNSAANAGKKVVEAGVALQFYAAGFKVKELVKAL